MMFTPLSGESHVDLGLAREKRKYKTGTNTDRDKQIELQNLTRCGNMMKDYYRRKEWKAKATEMSAANCEEIQGHHQESRVFGTVF